MTTRQVHEAVRSFFGNYDYPIFNSFIFDWESDFFAISKTGYSVEVEVKVSKQDFKKDFACKTDKHKIFTRHKEHAVCLPCPRFGLGSTSVYDKELKVWNKTAENSYINFVKPSDALPNKFFYACPEGLISPDEVPAYSGLIWTTPFHSSIIKPAPFLHKNKKCFDKILLSKYYHRNNEIHQLLCHFKRHNNLNEEQNRQLVAIINRMH